MERPDLTFNYYYPFYTQSCIGQKKYFYTVETVVHLSDKRGILLSIRYKQKKVDVIEVKELNDERCLFDKRDKGSLIHYVAFAEEAGKVYKLLSSARRQLSSDKAYKKTLIFTSYLKHNQSVEIELDFKDIHINFDCSNYVIESGQIMRKRNVTVSSNTEESQLMEKLNKAVSDLDANTRLLEIDDKEFREKLDRSWNYFIEFFKCPKFIKKSEYLPK